MPLYGGGKQTDTIHRRVIARLQEEFGFNVEDSLAVRSILYEMATKEAEKTHEKVTGLDRAEAMESLLTKKVIKSIKPSDISKRKEMLEEARAKRRQQSAGKKKASKKKKASSKRKVASSKKKVSTKKR